MTQRPGSLDVVFVDYDNVRFHLTTPERKTVLRLSMSIRCWDELVQYGALDILGREYGPLLSSDVEPDYNVSLDIDLEQVPTDPGTSVQFYPPRPFKNSFPLLETRDAFVTSLALLKRNALAAPFERAFNTQKQLETSEGHGDLMQVHYRDEEAMYIQAAPDRVTVIFSTVFREETDRIFGKVFLQVFIYDLYSQSHKHTSYRNLLMQGANRLSKLLPKSCTQAEILLLKFVMCQAFETATKSVTLPLYSSLAILQMQQLHRRLFHISSFSVTTCTTISSAQKHTCILG
jgi:Arp2/3 complex, 34 kD subunit p34-Arc